MSHPTELEDLHPQTAHRESVGAAVVIACFSDRRWVQLSAAVGSVLEQTVRPQDIVLVVDHNDGLKRRAQARWPELRVLENRFPRGASGARNTGAFSVDAGVVAFLDDDAVAEPQWLQRLVDFFDDPTVVGVGGAVEPAWETGRPSWFPDPFSWVVGASTPGAGETVTEVRNVWAENMAVRSERFLAVGGFRPDFGKVGTHSSPEDTDLCIRMTERGGRWLLVPAARVHHHVPADRTTFRYFLRRSFFEGEGKAALQTLSPPGSLAVERAYLSRELPQAFVDGLRSAGRQKRLVPAARSAAIAAGVLAAALGYAWGAVRNVRGSATRRRRLRRAS
jgi:GT2 family glycosyltransferase